MSTREPQWLPRPTGTDRSSDPILTMTAEQKAVFLEVTWYSMFLNGYVRTPIGRALADRRHHPRVGDLVVIPDAMRRRAVDGESSLMGVGYLVAERIEPSLTEEGWRQYGESEYGGICPEEQIWYVQYDPRATAVCRWENAECQAVPRGGEFAEEVRSMADRYMTGDRSGALR